MFKAVIVDDEPYSCQALSGLLQEYCPQIYIVAVCHSVKEAMMAIRQYQPSLLFLDRDMPGVSGPEMMRQMAAAEFKLIFTSDSESRTPKATDFGTDDCLQKPISPVHLQYTVNKIINMMALPIAHQLEVLLEKYHHHNGHMNRIALPTLEGFRMVAVDHILYCASDSNYTLVQMKDNQRITVSRTLKDIEVLLEPYHFLRVHHSYLVNLNEVERYVKGEGGYLVLTDGSHIDVSRSRKEILLQKLQHP